MDKTMTRGFVVNDWEVWVSPGLIMLAHSCTTGRQYFYYYHRDFCPVCNKEFDKEIKVYLSLC